MADGETSIKSGAGRPATRDIEEERAVRRRMWGFSILPLTLLPLLALYTYDWHDIAELCIPPNETPMNMIGIAGARFAYAGYKLVGLAVWAVPLLMALAGFILACGRAFKPSRRMFAMLLFMVSGTSLLELMNFSDAFRPLLEKINIADAGGNLGYLVMKRGLADMLSPMGAAILMTTIFLVSLTMLAGIANIARAIEVLSGRRHRADADDGDGEEETRREAEAAAARLAREAARRQREEEKLRIAEEKQRKLEEKEALREAARREREAERARKEDAQASAEKERLAAKERIMASNGQGAIPKVAEKPQAAEEASHAEEEQPAPAAPYELPPVSILAPVPVSEADHGDVDNMAQRLIDTLKVYDINCTLAFTVKGPVVTQYALEPELGVRVERIASLAKNLQMALRAKSLRIQAPIPGENAVGIEVPNKVTAPVIFREIIESKLWKDKTTWPEGGKPKFFLPLLLGKDVAGRNLIADLAQIPHLLIGGATKQGKSVCLNSIINGFLMCRTPDQLRLIMVDPKRVEFNDYGKLPHLLVPIVNDTNKVVFALRWATKEMDRRLRMFSATACRNIEEFNSRKVVAQPDLFGDEKILGNGDIPRTLPYIVVVIDELADIMDNAGKEVEPVLARLLALARAAGIHLIIATQRPDTRTIAGTLKSNIPGRIAFKTSQGNDSRTILDTVGAETLIGRGDMLFKTSDGLLLRAQGAYIPNNDIYAIRDFIGERAGTNFDEKFAAHMAMIKESSPDDTIESGEAGTMSAPGGGEYQPGGGEIPMSGEMPATGGAAGGASKEEMLYNAALDVIRRTGRASTSHLQRRMNIGYNHAARVIDLLEERGIIGPAKGAGPREILVDLEKMLATATEREFSGNGSTGNADAASAEADMPQDADGEEGF
ncbi:MAG: DNA translocase FtsK 4TM domain-containing protein [Kiritimatiellae bacterium]|nr:DNA translocase FtsK 4TM domain-containing protein [Kiritimatiellia bacterium]